MGALRKAAVATCVVALGCGPQTAIALHGGEATTATRLAGVEPDAVERTRRRQTVPAQGVGIEATLWDGALVEAGLERARARGDDEANLAERRSRWVARYLADATSFTVVIELANRPGSEGTADPLADPAAWSFVLDRGSQRGLTPNSTELEAIDRFPTEAGGHHLRLAFAVRFAGQAWPTPSTKAAPLRLHVRADARQLGMRRRELGLWVAKRGATLSWWVAAAP